jgi:hypothetical protein
LSKQAQWGIAGLVLLLPALILVTTGVLELARPDVLVHPALVMGGLFVALALNALPVLRLALRREEGALVGTVRLQVRDRGLSLLTLGLGVILLAAITAYLLIENFQPRIV